MDSPSGIALDRAEPQADISKLTIRGRNQKSEIMMSAINKSNELTGAGAELDTFNRPGFIFDSGFRSTTDSWSRFSLGAIDAAEA